MVIRRSDARANQARVLEAAREVFAEQGLAAEIKDIAQRAGVGVATIYRGFGSKNGLLIATVEQAKEELVGLLNAAEANDNPATGMRDLLIGMFSFGESYGWLIQASLEGHEMTRFHKEDSRDTHVERFTSLIQRGIDSGVFLPSTPLDVVLMLIEGAVVSLTVRVRKHTPRPSPEQIADGIVTMLTGAAHSNEPGPATS